MLKSAFHLIAFCLFTLVLEAQELPYAIQRVQQPIRVVVGTFPAYQIYESVIDNAGNTYVTGFFRGTADFDPGVATQQLVSQSPSVADAFFAKYGANGALVYVKAISGLGDKTANTIALTSNGKVLIGGYFFGFANFDPGVTDFSLGSLGGSDAFYARFDAATGAFESASATGGAGNDGISKIVVASNNDAYMYGYFAQTVDFDFGVGELYLSAATSGQDRFIAKYDDLLTLQWAHALPNLFVTSIALDASSFIVTGSFQTTTDMDPGPTTLLKSPAGSSDIWLSKFDLNGNLVWNNTMGGVDFDNAVDIAVDAGSNIYIAGNFNQTADFDPSAGVQNIVSNGLNDAFSAKYNSAGGLDWVRSWGGSRADQATSLVALDNNRIVICGTFSSLSMDIDPGAGTKQLTNAGPENASDAYLIVLNDTGNLLDGFNYGASGVSETAGLINGQGSSFSIIGNITQTIDFDPSSNIYNLINDTGFQQAYLASYSLLSTLPAAQATALTFPGQTTSSIDVAFTPAAGADGYLVMRRANAASTSIPKDGFTYNVGNNIGDGMVVSVGAVTSFTDNNLAADVNYHYSVFAYTESAGAVNYLTANPLVGNLSTIDIVETRLTDSLTLVSFYNATNGAVWTNNTNWLSGTLDTWYGINLNGNRVSSISLANNLLQGSLPLSFSNLSAIDTLILNNNQLSGTIPPDLSRLASLQVLNLANNSFTGSIPSELGVLPNLRTLDLGTNQLTGSIPTTLGNISSLLELRLLNNLLSGPIPTSLATIPGLSVIILNNNPLITNIPIEIGNISTLTILELQNCQLTGSIPTELGNLSSLTRLDLGGNFINGRQNNIIRNRLTGGFPASLTNLTNLNFLNLSHNELTGTLPAGISNLTNLGTLWLSGNYFTFGAFPPEVLSLPNITILYLSYCGITGNIPTTISDIPLLTDIFLDFNEIESIPVSLAAKANLNTLVVSNNQLSTLPDFSGTTSLNYLEVRNNNLQFDALEPNILKFSDPVNYAPQNQIGTPQNISLVPGNALNIAFSIGGSANTYTWRLNNVIQPTEIASTISIVSVQATNAGTWGLTITNSLVPSLTLTTSPAQVTVVAESVFTWQNGGDLTTDGNNASMYSGVWGDFDNDGFEDIYTLGVNDSLSGGLYRNNGNGTFTRTNAIDFADGRSGTWGDYNNDGNLDLFVPDFGFATALTDNQVQIYKNNGNGTFTKINLPIDGVAGTWGDFDIDGDLDISISSTQFNEVFFRNDGNDVFTRIENDINDNGQWNNIAFYADADIRLDYLIPSPNSNVNSLRLFYGNNSNQFYDGFTFPTLSGLTRGASVADIDNDGDYDIYVMLSTGVGENAFFINDGYGYFTEEPASIRLGELVRGGRGSAFGDLNNDGHIDLITDQNTLAPNGWTVYFNNGDGTFTRELNQTFKNSNTFAGIALGDYDNNGFLDAVSATFNPGTTNGLYRNTGNANHWLKIKLTGSTTNRNGIGARIAVKADGFWRHHQVITTNGFANQNSLLSHFGTGSATVIDSVVVKWPSGYRQIIVNQAADQLILINEPLNPVSDTDMELIAAYQVASQNAESFASLEDYNLDNADNMLISGYFIGSIDFDPGAGVEILTSSSVSNDDNFIGKYTSTGALAWIYPFANDNGNRVDHESTAADPSNNVIIAGMVSGTFDVDPTIGVTTLTSNGLNGDPYFAKYSPTGNFLWAKQLLSNTGNYPRIDVVQVDEAGNVIITGSFGGGDIDADPGVGTALITNSGIGVITFLAKYDNDGNYIWSIPIGDPDLYQYPMSLATDDTNNIYLTYEANDSGGSSEMIISKYDANGTSIWAVTNTNLYGSDFRSLTIDETNNRLYIPGSYSGTPNFTGTSGSGTLPATNDSDNGYVAIYDLNGAFINAFAFESSNEAYPVSLSVLEDGNLLISGGFEGTIDLDPSAAKYEFYGKTSSFITKLSSTGTFIWGAAMPNSFGLISKLNSQNELASVIFYGEGNTDVDVEPGPGVFTISSNSNDEDFAFLTYDIQGGVLSADSLALQAFYQATGGPNWTNRTNWLSGDVSTWFGITVTNDKITAINLPENNLTGSIPADALILDDLLTINLAGNNLQAIPDLSILTDITVADVSRNNLDFGSLEYNVDVPGINYADQKDIIAFPDSILVAAGDDYILETTIGGTVNNYQWKLNEVNITDALRDTLFIESIGRNNMGAYTVELTNSIVTGLTLKTVPVNVLATADLSGSLLMSASVPATAGTLRLLRVTASNGYDTISTIGVNGDGTYLFDNVVLDDYQIVGFADTLVVGQERALPTYYSSTIFWEEADTLFIENSISELDILSQLEPTEPLVEDGIIKGIVQEDDGTGERTEKTSRIKGAGVTARRSQGTGRGKEIFVLVAYVFTNDEGEFDISGLPTGIYRINIQYPGFPMDETSFVDIPIGTNVLDEVVEVEATVAEGKISVRQLIITSLEGTEYKAEVYPNPASTALYINFEKSSTNRKIELTDMAGAILNKQSANTQTTQFDVSSLQTGIYLLKIKDKDNTVKVIRIAVQN
ncbi:hypothetical protein SanaruYs_30040 [Chryseotalea sanaruensis]|uniref:Fibronectin type-III domain-containing protein n=1 Tax=Chryseotalea sanaruensis TaxID=2482724 RepID=A0A401UCY5_9BACT|nr:leucine-rich repeat domain-containing protein [Chryseotalea sanaruensis]GCC52765.1 hypothetical protein SanaruYs_30040 [Chryseotalea sanaruensis]